MFVFQRDGSQLFERDIPRSESWPVAYLIFKKIIYISKRGGSTHSDKFSELNA